MARLESRAMSSQKSCGGAGGIVLNKTADLRLIVHCIVEDGVREAFLRGTMYWNGMARMLVMRQIVQERGTN